MDKNSARFFIAWLILVPVFALNCTRDKNPFKSEDCSVMLYPTQVGNHWEYERIFTYAELNSDPTAENPCVLGTKRGTVHMNIAKVETFDDSVVTYHFLETLIMDEGTYIDDSYYINDTNGLYLYAYRNVGWAIPKRAPLSGILFDDRIFSDAREITRYLTKTYPATHSKSDSITFEDPPVLSLSYPYIKGKQWIYRSSQNPWRIDKKVLLPEVIEVPAGKFSCVKIQWLYDRDENGQWDSDIYFCDYLCEQGLVKRSILFKNLKLLGQDGEIICSTDNKDEFSLRRVEVM